MLRITELDPLDICDELKWQALCKNNVTLKQTIEAKLERVCARLKFSICTPDKTFHEELLPRFDAPIQM